MRNVSLMIIGLLISGSAMANMASGQSEDEQIAGVCSHIKLNAHPIAESDANTMNVGNEVRLAFNHVLKQHPEIAQQPDDQKVSQCKGYVSSALSTLKHKSL